MKGLSLNTVLIVAVAVLMTLQVQSCLSGSKKPPDISGEIKAKDELIEVLRRGREDDRRMLDSTFAVLKSMESEKVKEYHKTVIKYEAIPVYINTLERDSLRAVFENF